MARQRQAGGEPGAAVERSLGRLAERLEGSDSLREGTVVFRLSGAAGGHYHLESRGRKVRMVPAAEAGLEREPVLEIHADAETVQRILDGEKDAAKQFFAGGIRVRGDLRYLSDVALELGLLEQPL